MAGDHLHVCGGSLEDEAVIKPDRFDAIVNKWEEIANMQQERRGTFGVAFQGKIFVAGGKQDSKSRLKTCEMYNTSTNEWQLIGSLNVPRAYGSMLCLKGTLYVLGGLCSRGLLRQRNQEQCSTEKKSG